MPITWLCTLSEEEEYSVFVAVRTSTSKYKYLYSRISLSTEYS